MSKTLWALSLFLSGACAGVALSTPPLGLVVLVSVVPLLSFIEATRGQVNGRFFNIFWGGCFFGFGLMGIVLLWFFDALPLVWVGFPSTLPGIPLAISVWALDTVLLGVCFGVAAIALSRVSPRSPMAYGWYPVVWVGGECLRAFWFSIYASGSFFSPGVDFSFGFLGYALSHSGFLWVGAVGGVLLMSGTVIFFNLLVYQAIEAYRNKRKSMALYLAAFCIACIGLASIVSPAAEIEYDPPSVMVKGVSIVPIRTNFTSTSRIPLNEESARREKVIAQLVVRAVGKSQNTLVLLPEGLGFFSKLNALSEQERLVFFETLSKSKTFVIDSEPQTRKDGTYEVAYVFDGATGQRELVAEKNFLAPFGEYLPTIYSVALNLLGHQSFVTFYAQSRGEYSPGKLRTEPHIVGDLRAGILLCSDILSPLRYQILGWRGVDVLLNLSSNAWIQNDSPRIVTQIESMALIHSVFSGKPYIQASNRSPSFAIIPVWKK